MVNGAGGGLTPQDGEGRYECEKKSSALSGEKGICALSAQREGWLDFNTGVRECSERFERVKTCADDPMLMYFSSGTSGNPKMVLHDSSYALSHIMTAKHWHDVRPYGLHLSIADSGWAKQRGARYMVSGSWRRLFSPTISTALRQMKYFI